MPDMRTIEIEREDGTVAEMRATVYDKAEVDLDEFRGTSEEPENPFWSPGAEGWTREGTICR